MIEEQKDDKNSVNANSAKLPVMRRFLLLLPFIGLVYATHKADDILGWAWYIVWQLLSSILLFTFIIVRLLANGV